MLCKSEQMIKGYACEPSRPNRWPDCSCPPAGGVDGRGVGIAGAGQRDQRRILFGLGARRRQRVAVSRVRREQGAHACAV